MLTALWKQKRNKGVLCKLQGCYSATENISENSAFILQSSLHENQPTMACVEAAIPIPDSRKKVDELFLYWLSEPSTQDMLRKELSNIKDVPCSELDDLVFKQDGSVVLSSISPYSSLTSVLRPGSPNTCTRTPSPPPSSLVAKSPSSPRARRSARKSPHGSNMKEKLTAAKNKLSSPQLLLNSGIDEVDFGVPEKLERALNVPSVSVTSSEKLHGSVGNQSQDINSKGGSAAGTGVESGSPARSRSPKLSSLPTAGATAAKPSQVCTCIHTLYTCIWCHCLYMLYTTSTFISEGAHNKAWFLLTKA